MELKKMSEYIKREAALECLKIARGYCPLAYEEIDRLPAADVELVRHGLWDSKGLKIRCSACASRVHLGTDDEGIHHEEKALFKYCPHCGAKMDLEGT